MITDPAQIPALYQKAMSCQKAGDFAGALAIYNDIITHNPNIAEVHFQAGSIFMQVGQMEDSHKHLQIASELKPNEPAIWQKYTEVLWVLTDATRIKTALKHLSKTALPDQTKTAIRAKLDKTSQIAFAPMRGIKRSDINPLIDSLNAGDYAAAERGARLLDSANPNEPVLADIIGQALHRLGQTDPARAEFERALKIAPNFAQAYSNYGDLELDAGNFNIAIRLFHRAYGLSPKMLNPILGLGSAFARKNQWLRAIEHLQAAQKHLPKAGLIDRLIGLCYRDLKQPKQALEHLCLARDKGIKNSDLYFHLAHAYTAMKDPQNALQSFDTALAQTPDFAAALADKGKVLITLGQFDAAIALFKQALEIDPTEPRFYNFYVTSQKIAPNDPIIKQMRSLFDDKTLADTKKADLGFSIVKALEDTKDYKHVFPYLQSANQLILKNQPYDIQTRVDEVNSLIRTFDGFDLSQFDGQGFADMTPIFVCGMPRSGTTLVEQILASHTLVEGGGEIGTTSIAIRRVLGRLDKIDFDWRGVAGDSLHAIGASIAEQLGALFPNASHITDKGISSYMQMGLILAAMPKARFIVVRRDPRDNLLSIYRNRFMENTHGYAYDLRTLGLYYNQFLRVIDFWRGLLGGQFYEVQYERLTAAPEEQARGLIDFCGLDWQEDCLNFHKTDRQINTLSLYQARQPIYQSSIKAWQRYETDLAPLFDALKEGESS